jgi:hypothetical protein
MMRDTGQIMDDLIPMGRLEGDVLYRGCWILDCRKLKLGTGDIKLKTATEAQSTQGFVLINFPKLNN